MISSKVFEGSFLSVFSKYFQKKECVFKVVDGLHTFIFSFLPLADQKNMIFVSRFWQRTSVLAITNLQIEKMKKLILSIQNGLPTQLDSHVDLHNLSIYNKLNKFNQSIVDGFIKVESFLSYEKSAIQIRSKIVKILTDAKGIQCKINGFPLLPLLFKNIIRLADCYSDFEDKKENLHPHELSFRTKNTVIKLMDLDDFEGAIRLTSGMEYPMERNITFNYILKKILERKHYLLAELVAEKITENPLNSPFYTIADAALLNHQFEIVVKAANKIPLKDYIQHECDSYQFSKEVLALVGQGDFIKASEKTRSVHKSMVLEFKMIVLGLAFYDQLEMADELARRLLELNDYSRSYHETVAIISKIKELKKEAQEEERNKELCIVQ